MFIVVYRPHNVLNCETQYIGPFASHEEAYDHLCTLPALGVHREPTDYTTGAVDNPGCKFVQELAAPPEPKQEPNPYSNEAFQADFDKARCGNLSDNELTALVDKWGARGWAFYGFMGRRHVPARDDRWERGVPGHPDNDMGM